VRDGWRGSPRALPRRLLVRSDGTRLLAGSAPAEDERRGGRHRVLSIHLVTAVRSFGGGACTRASSHVLGGIPAQMVRQGTKRGNTTQWTGGGSRPGWGVPPRPSPPPALKKWRREPTLSLKHMNPPVGDRRGQPRGGGWAHPPTRLHALASPAPCRPTPARPTHSHGSLTSRIHPDASAISSSAVGTRSTRRRYPRTTGTDPAACRPSTARPTSTPGPRAR